jgi:hypothetical protein
MMLVPQQDLQKASVPVKNVPAGDSVGLKSDSASSVNYHHSWDSVHPTVKLLQENPVPGNIDTISVCRRNSIEDVTFYDSTSIIYRIEPARPDNFPYIFLKKNSLIADARKAALIKHLRQGSNILERPLHDDWIILIILTVTLLFALIRKSSANMLQGAERFFLFRGVNDSSTKDTGGLFSWESTIKNLVSFFIMGLFGYSAASYYDIIPSAFPGIISWIISVAIIIAAVTLRHIICILIGAVSDERDVFSEYLLGVYQFYRFSAIFIFVLSLLLSYTTIFSLKSLFAVGIIVIATLYLMRVIRLFIIFINKNISLFYFILYLCALEILPVMMAVKYISGLV